jgi:FlaA1/EpsC-like NDP-sugar epimerase
MLFSGIKVDNSMFKGKTILVTGGVGSIGKEIIKELLKLDPCVVRVFDNNEAGLFELEKEVRHPALRSFLGDVRDKDRLKRAVEGVDVVFHAAALKHVPICEYNPFDAIKTNVIGTQNLIDVSLDEEVERVIVISTDKAANPNNVMGATKLLAERLTAAANVYKGPRKTIFTCVRFGNVMASSGSVMPVFEDQIKKGGPLTLTDKSMTRFMMPAIDAVKLVFKAVELSKGGEVFILKMPSMRIIDLAEIMVEELAPKYGFSPKDIKIKEVGPRPGEKIHEELMTKEEAHNALEMENMFVILPQLVLTGYRYPSYMYRESKPAKVKEYSSAEKPLAKKEVKKFMFRALKAF